MIEDSKTLLFYIVGLAGLMVVLILFTGQIEPLSAPVTPNITPVKTTATLPEADQKRCLSNHQRISLRGLPM